MVFKETTYLRANQLHALKMRRSVRFGGADNPFRRLAFMATTLRHFALAEPSQAITLEARVGAATWLVDLNYEALVELGDPDMSLDAMTVARIMENMKAKALSMRWFGGGRIALGANDLSLPPPEPVRLDDGSERMPIPWFQIVDVHGRSATTRRLKSVA